MIALDTLSGVDLVSLFNAATGAEIRRFESRKIGVSRLAQELATRGLSVDLEDGAVALVRQAVEPVAAAIVRDLAPDAHVKLFAALAPSRGTAAATAPRARHASEATDETVLSLLAEAGPCKIGVARTLWRSRDAAFAGLRDKQAKGLMRASVRRLEAAGKITKDGALFAVVGRA